MASPIGMANDSGDASFFGDILKPEGKIVDPTNPSVASLIILILNSEWQVQFYGGSGYTKLFGGKLVGGVNDQPMKATGTAGDITVLESPVDGTTVLVESGSGLSAAQDTKLTSIFNELDSIEGGFGHAELMRGLTSIMAGLLSGATTDEVIFKAINGTKVRFKFSIDGQGNRDAVLVRDLTP